MNINKLKILGLACDNKLCDLSLRAICKLIGIDGKPGLAKHHLLTLSMAAFIRMTPKGELRATKDGIKLYEFIKNNPSLFKKIERLYNK